MVTSKKAKLIGFGRYLLSEERAENIGNSDPREVYDSDLENFVANMGKWVETHQVKEVEPDFGADSLGDPDNKPFDGTKGPNEGQVPEANATDELEQEGGYDNPPTDPIDLAVEGQLPKGGIGSDVNT